MGFSCSRQQHSKELLQHDSPCCPCTHLRQTQLCSQEYESHAARQTKFLQLMVNNVCMRLELGFVYLHGLH